MEDHDGPGMGGRRRETFRRAASVLRLAAAVLVALAVTSCGRAPSPSPANPEPPRQASAPEAAQPVQDVDGTGIAILLDLSGSMAESVVNKDGVREPKIAVAKRALDGILSRLEIATAAGAAAPGVTPGPDAPDARPRRRIDVSLSTFRGDGVQVVRPMQPFEAADLRKAVRRIGRPEGHTPLGTALAAADRALDASGLRRRHVLAITDGQSTTGENPVAVLGRIVQRAQARDRAPAGVHFVAFDVDAAVFAGVKAGGATVVAASDEMQLGERLQWILETKILLEEEEPAAPSAK